MSSTSLDSPAAIAALLREIFSATLKALDPGPLVRAELLRQPLAGDAITVLALGKAALPMARAAQDLLLERVSEMVVVAPEIPEALPQRARETWIASTHPTPSQRSLDAAQALLTAASRAQGEILMLLSGGGSALAALPVQGLSLEAKSEFIAKLSDAGVAIDELNVVRKHLSGIKGGRLAAAAQVPVTTLLVSDVVGDSLQTIASGPTLPDSSTFAQALAIAESSLGSPVGEAADFLRRGVRGEIPETPSQARRGDRSTLLAGIATLAEEAERCALAHGLPCQRLASQVEGTSDSVVAELLGWASGPGLWIAGGEATVSVIAEPGKGGRAHHLALQLACEIRGPEEIQVLVAGSDGIDGNTQAAGAIVDNRSYEKLVAMGISPESSLRRCDSATALAALDAQILTGPTGVNHADLILLYRGG